MNSKERLAEVQDIAKHALNGEIEALAELDTALSVVKALEKLGELPLRASLLTFGRFYLSASAEQLARVFNVGKTTVLRETGRLQGRRA